MKLNFETSRAEDEEMVGDGLKNEPKGYRRLKFNELVSLGDFVHDESLGMQPWDGPRGFQAGSFMKPIYRPERNRSTASKRVPKTTAKKRASN